MDEALKYIIDYGIKKGQKDKTVHNLAMYFFAQRDTPQELIDYLKREELKKEEGHAICFEVDYALNVCKQKERDIKEKQDTLRKQRRSNSFEKEDESLSNQIKLMKKAQIILYGILNL